VLIALKAKQDARSLGSGCANKTSDRHFRTRVLLCGRIVPGRLVVECTLAQICARVDYVNGLQENLKGQDAASEEVRAEFKALVEECRTALRDRGAENDQGQWSPERTCRDSILNSKNTGTYQLATALLLTEKKYAR
jgi:hypothetical protein